MTLPRARILCSVLGCEREATCVGQYENFVVFEAMCDDHCGHGQEDGRCVPTPDVEAEQ